MKFYPKFDYNLVIWGREASTNSILSSGSIIFKGIISAFTRTKGNILDVGCGGGQFSKALKRERPDLNVTAIDIGEGAIKYAKLKPEGINFIKADARSLPFKDEEFDGILCIEVLEHIKNWEKVISEMHRTIKKGGLMYISVSCEGSLWTIQGILNKLNIDLTSKSIGHVNKLSYDDILLSLKSYGFIVKKRYYFGHFLRQLEDIFYVMYLYKSKKKPGDIWNKYKASNKSIFGKIILSILQFAIMTTNIESRLFWWFPGISIQIIAVKS